MRIGSKLSARASTAIVDRSWSYGALAPSGSSSRESRGGGALLVCRGEVIALGEEEGVAIGVEVIGDSATPAYNDAVGSRRHAYRSRVVVGWPCGQ